MDDYGILTNMENYFPEMVWEMVCERINKSDLQSISNSSPFFRNILKKRMFEVVLFPKGLEIILRKNETTKYIFTQQIKKKGKKKIQELKLRLVCKLWDKTLQNLYQNPTIKIFEKYLSCVCCTAFIPRQVFENFDYFYDSPNGRKGRRTEICTFLNYFDATHYDSANGIVIKNPFLSRLVVLEKWLNDSTVGLVRQINEMLVKYGKEIWYCVLSFNCDPGLRNAEFYVYLRNLIIQLPSLKVLVINYSGRYDSVKYLEDLKIAINNNEMPTFPDLKNILTCRVPPLIVKNFMKNNMYATHTIWRLPM